MACRCPSSPTGRYSPLKGAVSPYVDGLLGYSFLLTPQRNYWEDITDQTSQGGITAGLGAGVKMMTSQRFGLTIGMGYRFQRLTRNYQGAWWNGNSLVYYPVEEVTDMNRVELRFGILFN
jgi:hypothetical protein